MNKELLEKIQTSEFISRVRNMRAAIWEAYEVARSM